MDIMKLFKEKKVLIAGPCSFGTYEELDSIAKKLKELNIDILINDIKNNKRIYPKRVYPFCF